MVCAGRSDGEAVTGAPVVDSHEPIRIAAAVVVASDGRTLLVRKRGSAFFIQPGGKLEPGETAEQALARELREELGYALLKAEFVGNFSALAANEHGRRVEAALFDVEVAGELSLGAEIEEAVWIDPRDAKSRGDIQLAVLTRDQILPLICLRLNSRAC
jgi:8-oxo-dGTP diphosphatase